MHSTLRAIVLLGAVTFQAACGDAEPPPQTPPSVTYTQNVTVVRQDPSSLGSAQVSPAVEAGDAHRVLILQTTHLGRPAEVVGVVDVHEAMGRQEDALVELQRKAALLGADAIVGVEFHHGEEEKGPTHLSGLAVRFIER